jgi:tetratricopeptide (TPR) repeat protein
MMGATSQRMIREFADVLDSYCSDSLLVLALEDVHRADPSTLDLLEYLASRTGPAKLFVIATVGDAADSDRIRALIAGLHSRQLGEEIGLDVLSQDDVRKFLDAKYPPSHVGSQLAQSLHQLSSGMPLFLCSAVRYLEEKQWILKTEHGWIPCTETIGSADLAPPVLREVVEVRVRQLSSEDQRILEAASIAGTEFSVDFVKQALDEPSVPIEEACNRIARQGGWLQSAGFGTLLDEGVSPKFRFLHELFREVLYARQSAAERVRRHRRVAIALESRVSNRAQVSTHELALHFAAGQECSKSLQYLRAAAAEAQRRYSGAEAAALLTQALSLLGHLSRGIRPATEVEVLCELGAAYFSCGNFENAATAWHKALTKAVKYGRIDMAVSALASLAFPVGWDNPERLRSASTLVLAHVDEIGDPVARSEATIRALALCTIAGTSQTDHSTVAANSLRLLLHRGDPGTTASARIASCFVTLLDSEYEAAIDTLEESIPLALDRNDVIDVIHGEWLLSWALLHNGQWGRMQSVAVAAADHARRNGNSRIEALFLTQLAWLHVECGAYQSAQNLCRRALESYGNSSGGIGLAMCHIVAGMAAIGLNDGPTAIDHVECASITHLPPGHFWRFVGDITALRAHLIQRNHSEVQKTASRLVERSASMTEKTWKAVAMSVCAEAAARSHQLTLAQTHSDAALQLVTGADLPLAKWRVEAIVADLLSSQSRKDATHFSDRSRKSRKRLFNSMDPQDPLRRYARDMT